MMFLLGYIAAPPTILVISAEAAPDMHAPATKTAAAIALRLMVMMGYFQDRRLHCAASAWRECRVINKL